MPAYNELSHAFNKLRNDITSPYMNLKHPTYDELSHVFNKLLNDITFLHAWIYSTQLKGLIIVKRNWDTKYKGEKWKYIKEI